VHRRTVRGRRGDPVDLVGPAGDPASDPSGLCHVSRRAARGTDRQRDHRGQRIEPLLRARGGMTTDSARQTEGSPQAPSLMLRLPELFVRLGVLPFLLLIAIIVFSLLSSRFYGPENIKNVLRQSSYLTMVAMGQMLALLTGGFDLSVGTILAVTSVFGAAAMASMYAAFPDAVLLSIAVGM